MSHHPTPAGELSEDHCWARLRAGEVARLAVIVDGHPEIFPVNYVVDRGSLVFRTAEGTKVSAALSGQPVAVEVDGLEADAADDGAGAGPGPAAGTAGDTAGAAEGGTGGPTAAGSVRAWSVVLKGTAEQITGTDELMDTTELPLTPWQAGAKGKFVRIVPTQVTGRSFPVVSPETWRTSVSGAPHAAEE